MWCESLKKGKAPGPGYIVANLIKSGTDKPYCQLRDPFQTFKY